MKYRNKTKRQQGFFDLGLSVAILALSGVFVYAATPEQDGGLAAQDAHNAVVAEVTTGAGETNLQPRLPE